MQAQFRKSGVTIITLGLLQTCFSSTVYAEDFSSIRSSLYGEWGTDAQCAQSLLVPGGTKRAAPFDIRPGWLAQGDMWCRLNWRIAAPAEDGLFALASALCGEDTMRAYDVRFRLNDDGLTLIWGLWIRNGPLQRCAD